MESQPQAGPESPRASRAVQILIAVAVSVVLVVPCFRFSPVSGDRPSHIYNTWLAHMAGRGEMPGLRVADATTNVLYDWTLDFFLHFGGERTAERLASSLFVLLFFWGITALLASVAKRIPWRLLAVVAMLAYGWTFSAGLMNFYGAIGIASFGIALWWSGAKLRWFALALGAIAFVAHPLGAAWLVLAIGWHEMAKRTSRKVTSSLIVAAIVIIFCLRWYLTHHFQTFDWPEPLWVRTGVDQFWLFRDAYQWVGIGVLVFLIAAIVCERMARRREAQAWPEARVLTELYVLLLAAIWILPNGAMLPIYPASVQYVASRSTLLLVVMLAAMVATARPRAWHCAAAAVLAVAFFWMAWVDLARLDRMERQAQQLVAPLPQDSRVIALLFWPGSRVILYHLPDLACIGHCYSYADYEPASQQFRLRSTGPNRNALHDPGEVINTQIGHYVVRPEDQPIYQLYQCGSVDQLCLEPLATGEMNGMVVVQKGWLAKH